MKIRSLLASLVLGSLINASAIAQDDAPPIVADLQAVIAQVVTKARAGQDTAADLAPEIAAFDALIAKYRTDAPADAAQAVLVKASLFAQVLDDTDTARELLTQLKVDFPGTEAAGNADRIIASIDRQAAAKAAAAALVGSAAPELDFIWSSKDGLENLSNLKGQVVVLDFWATWCGPCVSSFPQVRELTAHYAGSSVAVVGVTSIQGNIIGLEAKPINTKGDPEREMGLMKDYIKAKDITWTVAFSEQPVFNEDYGIQGIPYVAIIAPDGTVRHTGLHPASPLAEKTEKIDAILREFNLPVPAAKG
jgi:thiol-disulfide isomerase/thioredoxin